MSVGAQGGVASPRAGCSAACTLNLCQSEAPVPAQKLSVSASNSPGWLLQEFVVAEACAPCSNFQANHDARPECGSTGYVEKITCSSSKRNELKSCRSALVEHHSLLEI
uniref:Protein JTB n=1 Tax=Lynx canadensis TaxID=61383 RepID=A0A667HBA7_LYNCA